jgi:hypothetical protein
VSNKPIWFLSYTDDLNRINWSYPVRWGRRINACPVFRKIGMGVGRERERERA